MRKIFLEDLPKDKHGKINRINWSKSINNYIKFIYDNLQGEFQIINYTKEGQWLQIKYLDDCIFNIKTYEFTECKIKEKIKDYLNIYTYDETNPRRVDLRGLDKTSKGINWRKSEGNSVEFNYDELFGVINILKYNGDTRVLTVQYLDTIKEINTSRFVSGHLGILLNKHICVESNVLSNNRNIDLKCLKVYNKKQIDWNRNIGEKVHFVYDDNIGVFEILEYIEDKNKLKVKYLNNEHIISTTNFKNCKLDCIFPRNKTEYLYKIGDIIDVKNGQIEVLDLGKYKSGGQNYIVKCLNCEHIRTIDKKGIMDKRECQFCSKNKFRLSENNTYWIGTTQDGIDFWFDGNKQVIEYIKSFTWRKTTYDYFQNRLGEKLHRVIMEIKDKEIYVNHLGGRRWDNRRETLTISNCLDNSKEKKLSNRNKSGITGLIQRGKNNKWIGCIKVNDIGLFSSYKEKDEALIDLLIMQREYDFRHNVDLYYLLDDISQDRIDEVINLTKRQLSKKRNDKIKSSNIYELSECATYYNVYDNNKKSFKINIDIKEVIEKGLWHVAYDRVTDTEYVHGTIIINNTRKTVKLHRYLFGLLDIKYRHIFVDHLNGDSLDNRMDNLELTDANGNGKNKPAKGYHMRWGKARASITVNGKVKSKTFEKVEDAENWYKEQREESMKNRLSFKNKEEVNKYLISLIHNEAI
jgi:hypothetical protein